MSVALWQALGAGYVTEAEAEVLSMLIEARKALPVVAKAPPQRVGSRPLTDASMERRRRWAASGRMPPGIACRSPRPSKPSWPSSLSRWWRERIAACRSAGSLPLPGERDHRTARAPGGPRLRAGDGGGAPGLGLQERHQRGAHHLGRVGGLDEPSEGR